MASLFPGKFPNQGRPPPRSSPMSGFGDPRNSPAYTNLPKTATSSRYAITNQQIARLGAPLPDRPSGLSLQRPNGPISIEEPSLSSIYPGVPMTGTAERLNSYPGSYQYGDNLPLRLERAPQSYQIPSNYHRELRASQTSYPRQQQGNVTRKPVYEPAAGSSLFNSPRSYGSELPRLPSNSMPARLNVTPRRTTPTPRSVAGTFGSTDTTANWKPSSPPRKLPGATLEKASTSPANLANGVSLRTNTVPKVSKMLAGFAKPLMTTVEDHIKRKGLCVERVKASPSTSTRDGDKSCIKPQAVSRQKAEPVSDKKRAGLPTSSASKTSTGKSPHGTLLNMNTTSTTTKVTKTSNDISQLEGKGHKTRKPALKAR